MGRGSVTGDGSRAGEMARNAFRGFARGIRAGQFAGGCVVLDNFSALGLAGNVLSRGVACATDAVYSSEGKRKRGLEGGRHRTDELARLFPPGTGELEKARVPDWVRGDADFHIARDAGPVSHLFAAPTALRYANHGYHQRDFDDRSNHRG